jgi:hypothetical protein
VVVAGGPVLFTGVAFGQATPYADVVPGTVDFEVRLAGTPEVALTIPSVVVAVGTVYSFSAIGLVGAAPPLGVLPLIDS